VGWSASPANPSRWYLPSHRCTATRERSLENSNGSPSALREFRVEASSADGGRRSRAVRPRRDGLDHFQVLDHILRRHPVLPVKDVVDVSAERKLASRVKVVASQFW